MKQFQGFKCIRINLKVNEIIHQDIYYKLLNVSS
jgi:hypothetical protein